MKYRFIIAFFLLEIHYICGAQNGSGVGLQQMKTINNYYQYDNPVFIAYQSNTTLSETKLTSEITQGDYYRVTRPASKSYYGMSSEGYFTKDTSTYFYGRFSYQYGKEKNVLWNNTSMVSEDNPYILGDSISSDRENEVFHLVGKISSPLAQKIRWGLAVDYKVGNKRDQEDPRPEINSSRVRFTPGVLIGLNNWSIGVDPFYENFKEEIVIEIINTTYNYRYFRFKGLGDYQGTTVSNNYTQMYLGWAAGGNLQIIRQFSDHWQLHTNLSIEHHYERAQKGASTSKYLSGDYSANHSSLNLLLIQQKQDIIQKPSVTLAFKHIEGIWFKQSQETNDDGLEYWEVYDNSIGYIKDTKSIDIGYQWTKLKNQQANLDLQGSITWDQADANLYPSQFYQKFQNLSFNASMKKFIYWQQASSISQLHLGYRTNLSEDIYTSGLELQDRITYPEYDYLIVETYTLGFSERINTAPIKSKIWPFFSAGMTVTSLPKDGYYYQKTNARYFFNIQAGIAL